MKLSTALRNGARGQRQGTGYYFLEPSCCCAMGAIFRGLGIRDEGSITAEAMDRLREIVDCDGRETTLNVLLADLNDHLGWSFDEIADWLEHYGW